jgi:hypothetical protein
MRLISLHVDAVRALERLRIPFDDLTPDGLWGSPYHLIGLTAEQRSVLQAWNVNVNDITPQALSNLADLAPQLRENWPPRRTDAPSMTTQATTQATTTTPQPARDFGRDAGVDSAVVAPADDLKKQGDPLGHAALEREMVGRAAAAAEASGGDAAAAKQSNGQANGAAGAGTEQRDPTKLRVSVGGKYREASVKQGKILLDGQTYDSPAAAQKAVPAAKGDWVFWEYFDADAGKWRMLDRDWQPGGSAT